MWTVHRSIRPRDTGPQATSLYGEVDYGAKRIYLNPTITGDVLVETTIHEFLHARFPEWDEDAVNTCAQQLGRMLRRLK